MPRVGGTDPVLSLSEALAAVAGVLVVLDRPSDARHGDCATFVALRLAGVERRPPRDVAADLAARGSAFPPRCRCSQPAPRWASQSPKSGSAWAADME
jgi:hypothetical protein